MARVGSSEAAIRPQETRPRFDLARMEGGGGGGELGLSHRPRLSVGLHNLKETGRSRVHPYTNCFQCKATRSNLAPKRALLLAWSFFKGI